MAATLITGFVTNDDAAILSPPSLSPTSFHFLSLSLPVLCGFYSQWMLNKAAGAIPVQVRLSGKG